MSKILASILFASLVVACTADPVQVTSQRDAFIESVHRSCHGAVNASAVYEKLPDASKNDPQLLAKYDNICSKFIGLESN